MTDGGLSLEGSSPAVASSLLILRLVPGGGALRLAISCYFYEAVKGQALPLGSLLLAEPPAPIGYQDKYIVLVCCSFLHVMGEERS